MLPVYLNTGQRDIKHLQTGNQRNNILLPLDGFFLTIVRLPMGLEMKDLSLVHNIYHMNQLSILLFECHRLVVTKKCSTLNSSTIVLRDFFRNNLHH